MLRDIESFHMAIIWIPVSDEALAKQLPAPPADVKPLHISDDQRRRLEAALGKNFSHAHELVAMVERSMTIQVGETQVPLTPYLLDRLKSRCFGLPFDKFIERTVKQALEEFCGLR